MAISSELNYVCMRRAYKFPSISRPKCDTQARGAGVSLIRVDLKGKKRGRKAPYALGGKSSRKQSAAGTNGDLQQTARGVYWRLRLATMTTDASENRFRSPRERAPKFPPRLFTPHIVRFDERKCRRANLWPTILPCPRPRDAKSPRGDVYIKSTIIALLVRLFGGGARRMPVEGGLSHG